MPIAGNDDGVPFELRALAPVVDHVAPLGWALGRVRQDRLLHTIGLTEIGLPELALLPVEETGEPVAQRWLLEQARRCAATKTSPAGSLTLVDRAGRPRELPVVEHDPAAGHPELAWMRARYGAALRVRVIDLAAAGLAAAELPDAPGPRR